MLKPPPGAVSRVRPFGIGPRGGAGTAASRLPGMAVTPLGRNESLKTARDRIADAVEEAPAGAIVVRRQADVEPLAAEQPAGELVERLLRQPVADPGKRVSSAFDADTPLRRSERKPFSASPAICCVSLS